VPKPSTGSISSLIAIPGTLRGGHSEAARRILRLRGAWAERRRRGLRLSMPAVSLPAVAPSPYAASRYPGAVGAVVAVGRTVSDR
jgi:hypothetical protein